MKTMIHTLAYTALLSIALSSCNDDNAPILTQKGLGQHCHLF